MSSIVSRPIEHASARWGVCLSVHITVAALCGVFLSGCSPSVSRYTLVENSLRAGDFRQADSVLERAEGEYGPKNVVLYGMDRGMTRHLAGDYQKSNAVLEQAEEEMDRLYTRSIRTETAAFLTNDNALPFEGEPYEQVHVNIVKALNYAAMNQWQDALVEARRIDHRLNVLSDRVSDKGAYRDDAFARYLSGVLYESSGDINNAFIAYRKAYEIFQQTQVWSRTRVPSQLRADLLRTTDALHLSQEFTEYQQAFPDTVWQTVEATRQLAQVIVISYNGRAPRKEDQFLDLPISLDALQLVVLNRALSQPNQPQRRAVDSVLYGLNGRVVRVALPKLVPQKTQVTVDTIRLLPEKGSPITVRTESVQDFTALAEKALSERIAGITAKALARAAVKFTLAEGATRSAQHAAGKDAGPWVGLLVGLLTKGLAVASEESDKRCWRTLPDEIHLARAWVPPGQYRAHGAVLTGTDRASSNGGGLSLRAGETVFVIQRVLR